MNVTGDPTGQYLRDHKPLVGNTLYVGSTSTYSTIQDAINAASYGDMVVVENGTYTGQILVNKSGIVLRGNSTADCHLYLSSGLGAFDNPYATYAVHWKSNDTILEIQVDLEPSTIYHIRISGGRAYEYPRLPLEIPLDLYLTTSSEADPGKVSIESIHVDIPVPGQVFKTGSEVSISGRVVPPIGGIEVQIRGLDTPYTAVTDGDGIWEIDIDAPDQEGRFVLLITSDLVMGSFALVIEDDPIPDLDDDDDDVVCDDDGDLKEEEGFLNDMVISLGFIVLLVLILIAILLSLRKKEKEGIDREYDEE